MLFDPGPGQALRLALLALPLMLLPSWAAAAAPEDSGDRRPARQVVITIDDLPRAGAGDTLAAATEVTESILASLTRHHVPAVGFVVGQRTLVPGEIDARLRLLQRWQEAGAELGNHSWSHPAFNQTALPDYQDDVIRGDLVPRLLNQAGQPPRRYFRHPYNQTGNDQPRLEAFRAFMQARGMIITPFTVEHADYLFNTLWLEAVEDGDRETAQRLSRAYLDHMDTAFTFAEDLARETFGEAIPQVFLIHANDLNARVLDSMLQRLQDRGYRFISLDEALSHPAYATAENYTGGYGISWLHRWRAALGMENRLRHEPDPPAWILQAWQERQRAAAER